MCGIAGCNWSDKELIRKMTSAINHRGPDDSGFYIGSGASLGHRRLSIIDLSNKGHQPMTNENDKVVIVFNGEIWNYQSLRQDLQKKGHKFKSDSDTEVIIHGYEQYGAEICSRLDGMFAFALYDVSKKLLLLARDPLGKKPLYYHYNKGKILFASEIKAILANPSIKREVNEECLSEYLTLRYSPRNLTMFKGIFKLPQGHYALVQKGKMQIKEFWKIPSFEDEYTPDYEKIDSLIAQAIKKRLIADVPIGVFLSGGLDSSTIVAYMSRFTNKIKTFSVGFEGSSDETQYARTVAKAFNTDHKELHLDQDSLSYLPTIVWHFDEPLADPAALPTFLLCKEVSKYVKVALSGEGGDEVFGGYDTFNSIDKLHASTHLPHFVGKSIVSPIARMSGSYLKYPKKQMAHLAAEVLDERSIESKYEKLFYFPFNESSKKAILQGSKKIKSFRSEFNAHISGDDLKKESLNYYFKEWIPNDLLMKADKMSMASGLEVRTPFLDKELLSYFAKLDNRYKHNRAAFKKVISPLLPKSIIKRRKQGFTLPISTWASDKSVIEKISPHIRDLSKRKFFVESEILSILNNPTKYKNDHRLWVLLNFELWYKMYFEGKKPQDIIL